MSAAQMQLLTAKLAPKDLAALKKQLLRPGFVEEWNSLDALAAGFAKVLLSKENATPSAGFKLFTSYDPEAVLWLGFTSKDAAVQERSTVPEGLAGGAPADSTRADAGDAHYAGTADVQRYCAGAFFWN